MSNANKVARYLTTIDSAPSYAKNILVFKPIAVAATFLFFHTLYCFKISTLLRRSIVMNGFFFIKLCRFVSIPTSIPTLK